MFYEVLMEKQASKKMMDALSAFAGGGGSSKHRKMLASRFGVQTRDQAESMLGRMRGQVRNQVKTHRDKQNFGNVRRHVGNAFNINDNPMSSNKRIRDTTNKLIQHENKATAAHDLATKLKNNRRLSRQHFARRSAGFDQASPAQRANKVYRNRLKGLYSGEAPLGYSSASQKMREYGVPSQSRINALKNLNK